MAAILLFFLLQSFPLVSGGLQEPEDEAIIIEGATMGTSYRIIYFDSPRRRNFKGAIDSLLIQVNQSINTYDPESEISRFNRSTTGICLERSHLYNILKKAKKIYRATEGAFDPTVMPLVNAWGFGPKESTRPTASQVDSLRKLTGFEKIEFSRKRIRKDHPGLQLDMGGIGQGYGVDVAFQFLRSRGIKNMLVELGGEGFALGKNLQKNKPWTIGILDPNSTLDSQFFKAYVTLDDNAFTTSGNYFNYKIEGGSKFGHTIDPVTGYPVQHSLLSASVFAPDCTTADGWATAFMVMGVQKAIAKAKSVKGMAVLFIYADGTGGLETYMTRGLEKHVIME